ncbi:MAG: hypothetical protein ACI8RC_002591 [Ilumatobacter sp.]|jgi:hypothetical protein
MTAPTTLALDDHACWIVVLEDLEWLLQRQSETLDDGFDDVDGINELLFRPTAAMPTMPRSLEGRARRLMQATDYLIERARLMSDEAAPRGRNVQRRPVARSTAASYFDRQA